ncbi:SAF domain-containing protein [Streptomyces sp. SID3343]|uniref:SAF domain-containing protein n=1 Tax=Streptomyces sp. SID3343 TaxID=2690260 RepID=UPI00136EB17B|nr:SAF domain-containing protein [Streptomyces sp. SID3343]MYW04748.1 Flp pilus assembly protein CpaB [Streptomyces sp. SID3343]
MAAMGSPPGSSFGAPFGSSFASSGPLPGSPRGSTARPALRRVLARHRRGLAALSAAVAVLALIVAVRPASTPTTPIVVAARDLPAGAVPGPADVALVDIPTALRPAGVLRAVRQTEGVALTGPLRRGEPLTDVRVARPGGVSDTGSVVLPARFADADAVAVLRPGDRIDVLAAPADRQPGPARLVASDAVVLARPPASTAAVSSTGALLMLEVRRSVAAELAGVATGPTLTYTIRRLASGAVAADRQ